MVLCVTGRMASGKNFVSSILENKLLEGKPFVSCDADVVVHKVLENPETIKIICETFGSSAASQNIKLLKADGSLDRRALGSILFKNPALLKKQEEIVYPETQKLLEFFISENTQNGKNVILNATLLYKIPSVLEKCDSIIFVTAPLLTRIIRAKKRDKMPVFQILRRFFTQRKLFSKYKFYNADIHKVNNAGNLKKLNRRIDRILKSLSR